MKGTLDPEDLGVRVDIDTHQHWDSGQTRSFQVSASLSVEGRLIAMTSWAVSDR